MIRAFVGLSMPAAAAAALRATQAGLPGRLIERDNLHLTLAFLGDLQGPVLDDVHYALEALAVPGFELSFAGVGTFGRPRPGGAHALAPRVPGLVHLRAKVARAARGAGVAVEGRRFTPHVTLARFGRAGPAADEAQDLAAWLGRRADFRAGPFAVRSFTLFRSHLGRNGAAYEALAEYRLTPVAAPDAVI